jgi:3-oxo-5-alpha-steroid 4-dehydrogenase 1
VSELDLHRALVGLQLLLAVATILVLTFISAPYGRHQRKGWGPTLPARLAWVLMESPPVLVFAGVFLTGEHRAMLVPLLLLTCWQVHYVNRMVVYPLRMRSSGTGMPIWVVLMGVAFNTLNAWINARWVSHLGTYETTWLLDPRFLIGVAVFAWGMAINLRSDSLLRRLRKPGETGYKIPHGGLYRWVSCPNYLGEIIEWIGWAIATWSVAGLAFAVYTAANVGPRALSHHRWYRERFEDYPEERKALIPFVL